MTSEEQAVRTAVTKFYSAIEDLAIGRGVESMIEAWHHLPYVTVAHPLGDWAYGWEQVLATWKVIANAGRPENAGSSIRDVRVCVLGDAAHAICIYTNSPAFNLGQLNCTNVLHRIDGVWKIVHHHADKSSAIEAALEKNLEDAS